MIVISRKADQGFWIGTRVHVVVQRIVGSRVQIGVEAPQALRVARDEIFDDLAKPHKLVGWDETVQFGQRLDVMVMECTKGHTYQVAKGVRLNCCPLCGDENGLEPMEVEDAEEV